jgi:DNA polymerase-3 subunit gamma/tau
MPWMSYQVLARSWRPQRFADLIGQDAVVRTLQNAISGGTLGHAYLFSGLRGVGKTTAARLLARAVNCVQGPAPEPCGECTSCTEIAAGASLDMVEMDGASNRGIDDVRDLREFLRYRPTRDRYRVIIVDEVHMLTLPAFNALLKSLEEPPAHILFVFATTERHKVPATILSRCQQLEFRPVSMDLLITRLETIAASEGFSITPGASAMIARAASGSVRDALSLVDQLRAFSGDAVDEDAVATVLGVPRFEQMTRLVEALASGRTADGLAVLRDELRSGHDATALYHEAGRVLRSLLHLAIDPTLVGELTEEQRAELSPLALSIEVTPLTRMVGLWLEHETLLRNAANRELALEVACLRLSRWPAVREIESLIADRSPGGAEPGPGPGSRRPAGATGSSRTSAAAPVRRPPATTATPRRAAEPAAPSTATTPEAPLVSEAPEAVESAPSDGAPTPVADAPDRPDGDDATTPEAMADADPGLALAIQVLGGELVSIRPDPPSPSGRDRARSS